LDFYFKFILPVSILEIIAAAVGTYLFFKNKIKRPHTWVVYYLWLMILVESYGFMVGFSKQTNYKYFAFLEGTFFQNIFWAYNIFIVIYTTLFISYFLNFIKNLRERIIIQVLTLGYIVLALILFIDLETLQLPVIPIMLITGSLLLFITILLFLLNLIKSDQVIDLKTYFPFYVAMGYLFFLLTTTPIDIYFKYYDIELNESYVNLRASINLYINLFLYSTITLGFILCFWKKKSY
tara:strand:- start:11809 stop:12519 length:711 start_codon:yes stop_codon:yes gene_type:complete